MPDLKAPPALDMEVCVSAGLLSAAAVQGRQAQLAHDSRVCCMLQ